jgi:hypothetical protein
MWYIVTVVEIFKAYVQQKCPAFEETSVTTLAICACLLPVLTYVVTFFLAFYDKTLFHYALTLGMFVVFAVIWLIDIIYPSLGNNSMPCEGTTSDHACEQCAIVSYVWSFDTMHNLISISPNRLIKSHITMVGLLLYAMVSIWGQVHIGFYSLAQAAIGGAVGFVIGLAMAALIYVHITSRFFTKPVQTALRWLCLSTSNFHNTYE